MGSNVTRIFEEVPAIPSILPSGIAGIAFDVSLLGGKKSTESGGKSSTGFGIIRDDKYANLGTPDSRRVALMSISLQTFLNEAMSMSLNGGPRQDQDVNFNCGHASKYPLHFAAILGDVNKIRYLIKDCGVDPNVKCKELLDTQPVSYSARYGQLSAVIALLKLGADPFESNRSGQNTLSESYKEGHLHVTYFLKEIARRLKAYFAAYRLAGQLGVNCCDHCLDRSVCCECKGSTSSSSETVSSSDDDNDDNESVGNGSVVTEHLGGGIRSSLAGPYNASDSMPNSSHDNLTKVRSDRFSIPRTLASPRGT